MLFSKRAARPDGALFMTLVRLSLVVTAAALVGALAGCGGGSKSSSGHGKVPADAVAIVGDEPIGRAEVKAMLAGMKTGYEEQGRNFPGPGSSAYRTLRDKVVDDFVQESEFEQRAKSDPGVVITDGDVDQRVADLKRQYYGGSEARYLAGLKSQGLSEIQLRTRIKAQALADAVFAKLSTRAKVPDSDLEAYYKAHHTGYEHPASRDVRQISVATRALADRLERQLKGGADFAKLAEQYSTDAASSDRGGRLEGGMVHGQVLPELERAAFALKTHEISAPVHTQFGWHILQALGDLKPATVTPLAQVRDTIQALLLQQAKQKLMSAWVKQTRAEYASRIGYAAGYGPPAKVGAGGR
jgi:parvulin-like peptidyl-prolyl isomerase